MNAHSDTPLAAVSSWDDVRQWLEEVGICNAEADRILLPLLEAARPLDQGWQTVLLLLFWRQLARISAWLSNCGPTRDERDSQIIWAFLETTSRFSPAQRPSLIGKKLTNDTSWKVRHHFARNARRSAGTIPILTRSETRTWGVGVEEPPRDDPGLALVDLRRDLDAGYAGLMRLVAGGRMSQIDALILAGCHLYGRSIDEVSVELGLTYEATKRRRQRAAKYLRDHAKFLSPDLPDTPLHPMRRAARKGRSHV